MNRASPVSNNAGIESIFASAASDTDRLKTVESLREPRSKYLIAITPRSGSSWLCDAMSKTHRFGRPNEALSAQHIPHIIKRIPGDTPEAYFRNVIRSWSSRNGVSGLKTSWFQFRNFSEAMKDRSYLAGFRWVYLTRRDLAAQAVSLYKAVETSVFHTNVNHDLTALEKLAALDTAMSTSPSRRGDGKSISIAIVFFRSACPMKISIGIWRVPCSASPPSSGSIRTMCRYPTYPWRSERSAMIAMGHGHNGLRSSDLSASAPSRLRDPSRTRYRAPAHSR
jgi:hypothetical protein